MSAFKRQRRNAIRPNSNQYADLLMFSNEQRLGRSTLDDEGVQESKSSDSGDSLVTASIASTVFQNIDTLADDDSTSENSEKHIDDDHGDNEEEEEEEEE